MDTPCWKRSHFWRSWRRRWFRLRDCALTYYAIPEDSSVAPPVSATPRRTLIITAAAAWGGRDNGAKFTTAQGTVEHVSFDTADVRNQWVTRVQASLTTARQSQLRRNLAARIRERATAEGGVLAGHFAVRGSQSPGTLVNAVPTPELRPVPDALRTSLTDALSVALVVPVASGTAGSRDLQRAGAAAGPGEDPPPLTHEIVDAVFRVAGVLLPVMDAAPSLCTMDAFLPTAPPSPFRTHVFEMMAWCLGVLGCLGRGRIMACDASAAMSASGIRLDAACGRGATVAIMASLARVTGSLPCVLHFVAGLCLLQVAPAGDDGMATPPRQPRPVGTFACTTALCVAMQSMEGGGQAASGLDVSAASDDLLAHIDAAQVGAAGRRLLTQTDPMFAESFTSHGDFMMGRSLDSLGDLETTSVVTGKSWRQSPAQSPRSRPRDETNASDCSLPGGDTVALLASGRYLDAAAELMSVVARLASAHLRHQTAAVVSGTLSPHVLVHAPFGLDASGDALCAAGRLLEWLLSHQLKLAAAPPASPESESRSIPILQLSAVLDDDSLFSHSMVGVPDSPPREKPDTGASLIHSLALQRVMCALLDCTATNLVGLRASCLPLDALGIDSAHVASGKRKAPPPDSCDPLVPPSLIRNAPPGSDKSLGHLEATLQMALTGAVSLSSVVQRSAAAAVEAGVGLSPATCVFNVDATRPALFAFRAVFR